MIVEKLLIIFTAIVIAAALIDLIQQVNKQDDKQ